MAPRATQASQKATQSQAARGKHKGRRAVDDDDDDEEEEAGGVSEEEGGRGKKGGLSEEVRTALVHAYCWQNSEILTFITFRRSSVRPMISSVWHFLSNRKGEL
jgi:hypothetical protein